MPRHKFPAPEPTYIGPPANHGGDGNKPIKRIVIHSTVSPCEPGGARKIANYFRTTDRDASAHYCVDPAETIQAGLRLPGLLPRAAEHRQPRRRDVRDALPGHRPVGGEEPPAMFDRTVQLVAGLCLAYGVPGYFRSATALRLGLRGVTTHAEVGKAWGQTHTGTPAHGRGRSSCAPSVQR